MTDFDSINFAAFDFTAIDLTSPAVLGAAALALLFPRIKARLALSRAKHRSLAGHSRMARRVAAQLPYYEYGPEEMFGTDGAPPAVQAQRRAAFTALARLYRERFTETAHLTATAEAGISDLQFTSAYRVPFQFSRLVRSQLKAGAFAASASGVTVTDLDGNCFHDLAGSYGVNVFGVDFYKDCMRVAESRARALGPVLGLYHPLVADNVARLRAVSGLDEVSFHMSGTEAVMQAVRLARYHTGRSHLVRFCGAYHGWWGDVQPGVGNPVPAHETYTLAEMSRATLHVLRTRRDIACVLVNPLQALHPNQNAPGDAALVDSARRAAYDKDAYTAWLQQLREVCTARGIALIFDEVFMGFRLAPGGAQEYFGVRADLVTYGKTLGGGLPVGVVCGRSAWMRRFRPGRPADVSFARGTFNAHPYVMAAMNEFLQRLDTPALRSHYTDLDAVWNRRADALNARLESEGLSPRVANMTSVWTVTYTRPSRYNWMFQYYLRAEGLLLSWVGTGRLIFSLHYSDADVEGVATRFVAAARKMEAGGWWWADATLTNRSIRRQILGEMVRTRLRGLFGGAQPRQPQHPEIPGHSTASG